MKLYNNHGAWTHIHTLSGFDVDIHTGDIQEFSIIIIKNVTLFWQATVHILVWSRSSRAFPSSIQVETAKYLSQS